MECPKAFISYSHDSEEHIAWVLNLAAELRKAGIDALVDKWNISPGDSIPRFIEDGLSISDRVLAICTADYCRKANGGMGGVGYEKNILTQDLLKNVDSNRVIPVIRKNPDKILPHFLSSKLFIDFSIDDEFGSVLGELVRVLYRIPFAGMPPVGAYPFRENTKTRKSVTGGRLDELFRSASNGDVSKVRYLVSIGMDINSRREFDGATPLHVAISNDQLKVVLFLLKNSANLYEKDDDGVTPFDEGVKSNNELVKFAIGRSFAKKGVPLLFPPRKVYYHPEVCPYCLTKNISIETLGYEVIVATAYNCSYCGKQAAVAESFS